ncbi:MAG TPA: hypothetical protein DFS52_28420 [Myxococcales bacterium]|nr:hypothetical protein [Myxococcales bacterium]
MHRHVLALATIAWLSGCVALADSRQFEHRATVYGEQEKLRSSKSESCKVYVVPEAPRSKRLGAILVPAELASEQRLDDESRQYACGLRARYAVKEEETTAKDGKPIWRLGLYAE